MLKHQTKSSMNSLVDQMASQPSLLSLNSLPSSFVSFDSGNASADTFRSYGSLLPFRRRGARRKVNYQVCLIHA